MSSPWCPVCSRATIPSRCAAAKRSYRQCNAFLSVMRWERAGDGAEGSLLERPCYSMIWCVLLNVSLVLPSAVSRTVESMVRCRTPYPSCGAEGSRRLPLGTHALPPSPDRFGFDNTSASATLPWTRNDCPGPLWLSHLIVLTFLPVYFLPRKSEASLSSVCNYILTLPSSFYCASFDFRPLDRQTPAFSSISPPPPDLSHRVSRHHCSSCQEERRAALSSSAAPSH